MKRLCVKGFEVILCAVCVNCIHNNQAKAAATVTADIIKPSGAGTLTTFAQNVKVTKGLTVAGNTTNTGTLGVTGATTLGNTLKVAGDVQVNTNKFVVTAATGNTTVAGTLGVTGVTTLNNTLGVAGNLQVNTNKFVVTAATGNTTVAGTLGVTGATTLNNTLDVSNDLHVNTNKFTVTAANGNTAVAGTLGVTGATTLSTVSTTGLATLNSAGVTNNATVGGTLGVTGATTLNNTLDVASDLHVNTNKFTVAASTGNTAVAGTLGATGATTLGSTLDVAGDLHVNTNKVTVAASTGNTAVAGTLGVTGATTLSTLSTSGLATLDSLTVTNNATVGGTLGVTGVATFAGDVAIQPTELVQTSLITTAAAPYSVAWAPTWSVTTGGFIALAMGTNVLTYGVDIAGSLSAAITTRTTGTLPSCVTWAPTWSGTTGGFIAVVDETDNTLQIYGVNTSGQISASALSSRTIGTTGSVATHVAFLPHWDPTTGGFVLVVDGSATTPTIYIYSVSIAGVLSVNPISSQVTSAYPYFASWAPTWSGVTGGFIAAVLQDGTVQIFSVTAAGLISVSPVSATLAPLYPYDVVWAPTWSGVTGGFISVAGYANADGTIQTFSVDATGHLSTVAISAQTPRASSNVVDWSPLGNLIAVANTSGDTIQTLNVDNAGKLSSLFEAGYGNTGSTPEAIAFSPTGIFIAVASTNGNIFQIFSV